MGNCYGNRDDISERKPRLGPSELACRQKDSWEQVGLQGKNWSRWFCAEIQSKAGCTRFHSTVWNRLLSDTDWAGDPSDRKSTSGYIFMFSDGPISWRSKKQKCVALSTVEAEYVALSGATQEFLWLRQLEVELG